jgi:hypothetical protein
MGAYQCTLRCQLHGKNLIHTLLEGNQMDMQEPTQWPTHLAFLPMRSVLPLIHHALHTTMDQRLTPYGQAMVIGSLTVDDAIDDGFSPTPPEPDYKGKGKDKGKREATPQVNRRQPPHKQARNETYSSYPPLTTNTVAWKEEKTWNNLRSTATKFHEGQRFQKKRAALPNVRRLVL